MSVRKFYLTKLQKKPSENPTHSWADYLELLCLANIDGELSESDVISRLFKRQKDLKEGSKEEIQEEIELDSDNNGNASNRSQVSDRWELKVRDWFGILKMRVRLYKEFYPFRIVGNELKLKSAKQSNKQKLYIYLLLCSNLYLFDNSPSNKLSNSFELISFESIKKMLPKEAEVHLFGKNPLNQVGHFNTKQSLWNKMKSLASLLNETLNNKIKEEDYPRKNTGDDGLDIVAWLPTKDGLPSKIVLFCQCACGTDWRKKQIDSSYDSWSAKIELTNYTINTMLIPYCFRKSDGEWFKPGNIFKSFLIDRKRILEFSCVGKTFDYKTLPVTELIEEICEIKEGIV